MKSSAFIRYLKRDGWLLAAIGLCAVLCLIAGTEQPAAATEEDRISSVLSQVKGAGQVDVTVYYDESAPSGALIVADGAGDIGVRLKLTAAMTSLLGLEEDRIAVFERQEGE